MDRRIPRLMLVMLSLVGGSAATLWGANGSGQPTPEQIASQIGELIDELDAGRYDVRDGAWQRLLKLATRDELQALLGEKVQRALQSTAISFEVRTRLESLAKSLPKPTSGAAPRADGKQIEQLLVQLSDDSPSVRRGAESQLLALANDKQTSVDVYLAIKNRLASAELESPDRKKLRELLDQARGGWLLSDPSTWKLPQATDEQIKTWVDALAQAHPERGNAVAQEIAERELIDLLARDDCVSRVRAALEAKLADKKLDLEAVKRLEAVYDWTKPAMVAEYWQAAEDRAGVRHLGIQYVLVDVPSVPEGGVRATHFDRIDDQVAHCVSGNSLAPGDYPVGVFFPHPQQGGAQFHLINLPTPRRRLAYEYQSRIDDEIRSREITRRTLDRILSEGKPLSQAEILMLEELDDGQVSAFAGSYLMKVDDSYYPPGEAQFVGNLSRHLNFCCMLARSGRHEALPGLLKAIEAKRFLDPPPETPYEWPWVAVLCVTVHDPWPEVDDFLAELVAREQPLLRTAVDGRTGPQPRPEAEIGEPGATSRVPDLGATAAAVLLSRHGIPPSVLGVEVLMYSPLASLDCPGAYFRASTDRQRVRQWWNKRKLEDRSRG
jgi:hypothetical protein